MADSKHVSEIKSRPIGTEGEDSAYKVKSEAHPLYSLWFSRPGLNPINVNVILYNIAFSHSASNALGATSTAETDAS